jgi:hypothetical protein
MKKGRASDGPRSAAIPYLAAIPDHQAPGSVPIDPGPAVVTEQALIVGKVDEIDPCTERLETSAYSHAGIAIEPIGDAAESVDECPAADDSGRSWPSIQSLALPSMGIPVRKVVAGEARRCKSILMPTSAARPP